MDAQNDVYDKRPPGNEPDLKSEREKERQVITSSPPIKPAPPPSHSNDDDANSDAETVVLPGKDGYSPSKTRKVINKDDYAHKDRNPGKPLSRPGLGPLSAEAAGSLVAKKKKLPPKLVTKDGSSGLSSAPTSPPHNRQTDDSESGRAKSPRRERSRLGDKVVPHKRKASASVKVESDDELETRKARRQRLSIHGEGIPPKYPKDRDGSSKNSSHSTSRQRSVSPHHRLHRRSVSTQLPSSNGLGHKKKRIPAPLTTDYHSDESSTSGSPHPRSSRLQNLATPATADSIISPAKMVPHKKHLDAHGQTFLARACAKGEYEAAKARLQERPGDINHADYAGNTPLQIAALNGHDDIVKLLLEAGCNLECVNNDGDTPLLDAVDNGHLEVVKLLLDAGVNPRKTNLNGEEPLEHVTDDLENADEIRAAIEDACRNRRNATWRRPSEEQHGSPQDAYPPGGRGSQSPRHSPAAAHNPAQSRRGASSRLTKTSNAQLYKPLDDKTLRQAACRGDVETVERILQVKQGFDDAESMVGAARGGHETVMILLLALGSSNPDPDPVPHLNADVATPILAAIGQDNIGIIKLLLQQQNFDPTKKFNGETYYEIARRRQGPAWKEEESLLKDAHDRYKKTKQKSPRQKLSRPESEAKVHRRKASSPAREKPIARATTSPKRRKSFTDDQPSVKRGPGRPRKDDRVPTISISNRDASPQAPHKVPTTKLKRHDTDTAANSSEGEATAAKPRRKLISGRELKDEREKQRRSSLVSNSTRDGSSPRGHDDAPEPKQLSEKYYDRTKALRRDDSGERLTEPSKRHRSSVTPPHNGERDDGDVPAKRRRLDADGKEKRQRSSNSSPEDRHRKPSSHKEPSSGKFNLKDSDKEVRRDIAKVKKLKEVKSEDVDMPDAPLKTEEDTELKAKRDAEKRRAKQDAVEARKREEEQRLEEERKAEETRKREEEERRDEERKQKEEEEKKRKQMEEEDKKRKLKEEEEKKRKQREEEDKRRKQQEEEERKRKQIEQEERMRREEEERKHKEEEDKRRREEERKAKEARQAEEARKQEEARREEERKRRELIEREQARQEEMARIRIAQEAELRKMREEQERIRLSKLPPLLRWLDGCNNPKTPETARRFARIHGIRYDTIIPEGSGPPEKQRELWLLNTHAAVLLGEKDLSLQKYASWDRITASDIAKQELWGVENGMYSLVSQPLWDLAETLPGYSPTLNGSRGMKMAYDRAESRKLFVAMNLFFVKVSDFMSVVRATPHLRNIKLSVQYKELPLDAEMQRRRQLPLRWKHDPELVNRNHGAAPGAWIYMNGVVSTETRTGNLYRVSNIPFPEIPVPRRGFDAVSRNDPDFIRLAREQGLTHILTDTERQSLTNGIGSHSASPTSVNSERPQSFHALTPVTPGASEMVNGNVPHADEHGNKLLPNGINEASPRHDVD